jgi:hypothetical protein
VAWGGPRVGEASRQHRAVRVTSVAEEVNKQRLVARVGSLLGEVNSQPLRYRASSAMVCGAHPHLAEGEASKTHRVDEGSYRARGG